MLKQLDVYSPNISVAPYELDTTSPVEADPFQITNIDGLGPVAADINTTKLGVLDGEVYRDSVVGKRNIVLTVKPNPIWATQTIESLRNILNAHFAPKSQVRLVFTSTERTQPVEISGYVETFTPNIFSEDPEYQVSIICPYPYFVDLEPITVGEDTSTGSTFTSYLHYVDVNYIGTVPTGVLVKVPPHSFSATNGRLSIYNRHQSKLDAWTCDSVTIDNSRGLEVSTVNGQKYARETHISPIPPTSVMGRVSSSSVWIQLVPGTNRFQVASDGLSTPWTMTYFRRWAGL